MLWGAAMAKQWKTGDRVRLASGGPEMTVVRQVQKPFSDDQELSASGWIRESPERRSLVQTCWKRSTDWRKHGGTERVLFDVAVN